MPSPPERSTERATPDVRPLPRENPAVRFFGVLRESPAFHFHLLQLVGFLYLADRFASRNYTVYGLLPADAFDFPRGQLNELLPIPAVWFTTFQFLYEFLPRPGPTAIAVLQGVVLAACAGGVLGLAPRWCALVAFLVALHQTGMVQASNADEDGGSLILCLMLILALSPGHSFYGPGRGFRPLARSPDHHWPVFLLLLTVGSYYTLSGVSKLIDSGPTWPFDVHLERLAPTAVEDSLFLARSYRSPVAAGLHLHYAASVAGGLLTLAAELAAALILFLPRWRLALVATLGAMHFMILWLNGINFTGNAVVLLLCLDWNGLVRRATVLYDGECGFCTRSVALLERLDWFGRLDALRIAEVDPARLPVSPELLEREMGLVDEAGEVWYGADAFAELSVRTPLLWPMAVALRVPGVLPLSRPLYRFVARHRRHLGCRTDGTCALPPAQGGDRGRDGP